MNNKIVNYIAREFLWLLLIAVISAVLLYPIYSIGSFKFLWVVIGFISATIMYFRWTVFYKDIDYLKSKWFRVFIFLINFQIIILTFSKMQDIIPLWENQSLTDFLFHIKKQLSFDTTVKLLNYIKNIVLISGIACIVVTLALNIRILHSFFITNRMRKKAMLEDL